MSKNYDALVVGAGFSGAVLAERLASQLDWQVLVVEKRPHVGGNCYDYRDENGIFIHHYGPHIFHTDRRDVWEYLSRFTTWTPYQHRVLGSIDGKLVPLPFNLDSLHQLYPADQATELENLLLKTYGVDARVPILQLRQSNDPKLCRLAEFIYSKVFENYSRKQWGIDPATLNPQVTGRVPVLVSRDDRYFQDPWQAVPTEGYTAMISRIINHPNIKLMLGTDMREVVQVDLDTGDIHLFGAPFKGQVIYTGMLDALFNYRLGRLPYRTLAFELTSADETARLPVAVVNYPNDHDFTRITDFGHFIGRKSGKSTLMYEYPKQYRGEQDGMPFYPLFSDDNQALFDQYKKLADRLPHIHLLGRLAQYKYFDMDDAVAEALDLFMEVKELHDHNSSANASLINKRDI